MAIRDRPSKKAKNGRVWEVYFTYKDINGVTQRYSKSGFHNKIQAKAHEAEMLAEYHKNGNLITNKKKTFNEVFSEYMKMEGALKYAPSTINYYQTTHRNYIETGIGRAEIYKLRYKEVAAYFNDMACLGYYSSKNIKKIFNVTFKYALKAGYIPSNPMTMVTLHCKTDDVKEVGEISEENYRELCRRILIVDKMVPNPVYQQWNYFCYYLTLQIGWYCGLRISEALALKKEDFDFVHGTVTIKRRLEYQRLPKDQIYLTSRMKTPKSKATLPVAKPLLDLLEIWFYENPYDLVVCDIDGRLIHPSTFNARVRSVAKDMEIEFHYHMLRHTLASRLARNNVNPNVAKELLRHTDISTTLGIYTHINEEDEREALEKLFK